MSALWWYLTGLFTPVALLCLMFVVGLFTGETWVSWKRTDTYRDGTKVVTRKTWPRRTTDQEADERGEAAGGRGA